MTMSRFRNPAYRAIVALLLIGTSGTGLAAQTPDSASVQTLLDNWAEALGGREALDKLQTWQHVSAVEMFGMKGTMTVKNEFPGRHRFDLALADVFSITQVVDRGSASMLDHNGKLANLGGTDLQDAITAAYVENFRHLRTGVELSDVTYLGTEESSGFHMVRLQPDGGSPVTYYIDSTTWLPTRSEQARHDGGVMTTTYDNWTRIDGLLVPAEVHQSGDSPENDVHLQLQEMTVNPQLADRIFQLQEASSDVVFTDEAGTFDIPFEPFGDHILLSVMVNGSGPWWFGLDTGASATVIDLELARELELSIEGSLAVSGRGEGKPEVNLASGVSFALPGVELVDQTVITIPLRTLLQHRIGRTIDGVLGYDFLSRFVTEIDYAERRLRLHDPALFAYEGDGTIVPMEIMGSQPHIEASMTLADRAPVRGLFMLDTGSGGALSLNGPFAEQHEVEPALPEVVRFDGAGGIGGQSSRLVGRLDSASIGELEFDHPIVSISLDAEGSGANERLAGLIGGKILSRCTLFLDYASERVILEPNNHYRDPFEWDKSGITLVTAESDFHSYQVYSVVASSPAEEAGVCRGDFLVEVDDRQADQWSLEALKKLFEQDRPVSIVLRRDGELIRTELNLRPLI
jgi:hypothetical protein